MHRLDNYPALKEETMQKAYSYACKDYPGMEKCPGRFNAETEGELWKHIEMHASVAHGEDPTTWSPQDRDVVKSLIKNGDASA